MGQICGSGSAKVGAPQASVSAELRRCCMSRLRRLDLCRRGLRRFADCEGMGGPFGPLGQLGSWPPQADFGANQ
eukprot:13437878-Alexandrium_andersonii.AAC.1